MGRLKDDSNFQIYGWMATKLKLKGNELLIYAVIYSFSRNNKGEGVFNASIPYLREWTNSSKQNVIDCLNSLIRKKLIIKLEDNSRKRKPNVYRTSEINFDQTGKESLLAQVNKVDQTGKESLLAQVNKVDQTGKESLPNNNIINTTNNTIINATTTAAENYLEDICKLYLREISNKSCCSPLETDKLSKLISEYGADKVKEAIEIAVMRNRRSLAYIEGILKNTGGDENGSQKEKAAVVRHGRTSGRGGLYKSRKVETIEDVERKFANETSGWD